MVIGNGLIAQTLQAYANRDDVIIFASGVSNSNETREDEFKREKTLLSNLTGSGQTLIYFSTCSIFDTSISESKYVVHKLEMEEIISNHFENYIIFRLPTLIADTSNSNTLFNFFFNNIQAGNTIQVYARACRYLLDIEDVVHLLPSFINDKTFNRQAINIAFDEPIAVPEMIKVFEEVLNVKANIEVVEKGECFSIDNSVLKAQIQELNFAVDPENNVNCIRKYCFKALGSHGRNTEWC